MTARRGTTARETPRSVSISDLRREHPHMKATVVEDSLASNGPHVKALMENDFRFTHGAKPKDRELPSGRFEAGDTRRTWDRRDRGPSAVRLGLRPAARRRAFRPQGGHARIRGNGQRGRDDNVHVGHRSSARPDNGAGGHALRPSAVSH